MTTSMPTATPQTLPTAPPTPPTSRRRGPIRDARLEVIAEKVRVGERLSLADGMLLYETDDVWGVCELAHRVRTRMHGDTAYYNINRHLNYSNICALSCKFCEFYRKKNDEGAYTKTKEQIQNEAMTGVSNGATEMHIVGGLHPYLPWDAYPQMLRDIHEVAPSLHLKAFTAVEIVHLAKIARKYKRNDRRAGIRWVLSELKEAGLGSLPGGGAEVFDDRVHDKAYKGKIRSDAWLDVHTVAHELGLNSNCTILYGHIEQRRERLVHMDMLRRAQDLALARLGYAPTRARAAGEDATEWDGEVDPDWIGEISLHHEGAQLPKVAPVSDRCAESGAHTGQRPVPPNQGGYFQTIIPLPFFPDGSELEHLPGPSGLENLRTIAVARLMLDNFPHVKAFWIMQTLAMAQLMLQSGADDIDGTVVWYDITKVGGSTTHQEVTTWDLCKAIREAGFDPVERDTLYREVIRNGTEWRVAE